jgi:hypothetical protein
MMIHVRHMYFKIYILNDDILIQPVSILINLKTHELSHENVTILYKSN